MILDSRRLLYFLRIAEFGSLSQAAKSLGVAQPALSHYIRQLEEHLGITLLVRRPRGVAVTEAGANLLEHARAIVERIEEAERDLRSQSREITGTVNLGLPSSIAAPLTPLLLKALRERHPGIVLHVVEGTSMALTEWVKAERLDITLNLEGVVEHRTTPLFSEDLYLVGSAGTLDHLGKRGIGFQEAAAFPLMLPTRRHSMRMLIERIALEQGLTIRTVYEIDGFGPLKAAVAEGLGYSILSWAALQKEHAAGELSAARIVRPSIRRTIVLDVPPHGRLLRAGLAVQTILCDLIVDLFRTQTWRGQLRFAADGPSGDVVTDA